MCRERAGQAQAAFNYFTANSWWKSRTVVCSTRGENVLVPTLRVVLAIIWTGQKVLRESEFLKQLQPRTLKKCFHHHIAGRSEWRNLTVLAEAGLLYRKNIFAKVSHCLVWNCLASLNWGIFCPSRKDVFLPRDKFDATPPTPANFGKTLVDNPLGLNVTTAIALLKAIFSWKASCKKHPESSVCINNKCP